MKRESQKRGRAINRKIAEALSRTGRTQVHLAETIGVHQTRVSKWLAGEGHPQYYQLRPIADYFGWSLEYLVDDEQDRPTPPGGLTDQERTILEMVRSMGPEVAMARLLAIPPEGAAPGRPGELVVGHPRATPGFNRGGGTDPHPRDRDPAGPDEPAPQGPEPDPGRRPARRR